LSRRIRRKTTSRKAPRIYVSTIPMEKLYRREVRRDQLSRNNLRTITSQLNDIT